MIDETITLIQLFDRSQSVVSCTKDRTADTDKCTSFLNRNFVIT